MAQLISTLPDGMPKELAKLECQQVILRYRFNQNVQPVNLINNTLNNSLSHQNMESRGSFCSPPSTSFSYTQMVQGNNDGYQIEKTPRMPLNSSLQEDNVDNNSQRYDAVSPTYPDMNSGRFIRLGDNIS